MIDRAQAKTKRRRLRDRLIDRDGTENERLSAQHALANHLLLVDDDLRETALAIGDIESYLAKALTVLERRDLTRRDLETLAADIEIESKIAALDETLTSFRRRLHLIATNLK